MATNKSPWLKNVFGASEPFRMLAKFATGASQAIKRGEILEYTGNTDTEMVPIDSDFVAAANLAVADEEIKSGDRAGYYWVIVPRPGDVFEFELATATDIAVGASLYFSASQKVATTGSNPIGRAVGQEHYPDPQGHLADDASGDSGTTIKTTSYVRMVFDNDASWAKAWNQ